MCGGGDGLGANFTEKSKKNPKENTKKNAGKATQSPEAGKKHSGTIYADASTPSNKVSQVFRSLLTVLM